MGRGKKWNPKIYFVNRYEALITDKFSDMAFEAYATDLNIEVDAYFGIVTDWRVFH